MKNIQININKDSFITKPRNVCLQYHFTLLFVPDKTGENVINIVQNEKLNTLLDKRNLEMDLVHYRKEYKLFKFQPIILI